MSIELLCLLISCSKFARKNIHQIAQFQFQKYKIVQLLRGAHPPQTPPSLYIQASMWLCDAPPNHFLKNFKDLYLSLGGACNFEVGEGFGRRRTYGIVPGNNSDFLEE